MIVLSKVDRFLLKFNCKFIRIKDINSFFIDNLTTLSTHIYIFIADDTHQMFVDAAKRHTVLSEATDWSIAHSQSEAAAISLMYMDTMYEMRDRLAAASTNYNLTAMFAGSALIWMVVC